MDDSHINVAAVYPNGKATIFGQPNERGVRPRLQRQQFNTYGAARLWAQEYEDSQRKRVRRSAG